MHFWETLSFNKFPEEHAPVHLLTHKLLDYEEGELEHGDADRESIVSLNTKVSELTKPARRETTNQRALVLFMI